MTKYKAIFVATAVLASAACKDSNIVPPLDAPTVEAVSGALSRAALQPLATGVLAQDRAAIQGTVTYMNLSIILGRDMYRIESSEPRYVGETLGGNPDPGSFAGSGGFSAFYTAIRAASTLIDALPSAPSTDLSAAEKSATSGFLKTIKAMEYMRLIELRDSVGVPIQSADPNDTDPPAMRCKTPVLSYAAELLDSANTELVAAGASTKLPFILPTGWTAFGRDYGVVSNLILFNRALKGKVDLYRTYDRKNPQPSLAAQTITELTTALGGAAAGAVSPSTFSFGPYYKFVASGTEATPNPRALANIALNPMVKDSILAGDTRASKIISRTLISGGGVSSNITCALCTNSTPNQEAPLGILRDEEIVLLRAQAYIEAGNLAAATADINSVRTNYGLTAYPVFTTKAAAISAVLYEKRYSLLVEGPQRWIDLREYQRLNSNFLKPEVAGDPYNKAFPIPRTELAARGITGNENPACTN
jgi:hypothetical protein